MANDKLPAYVQATAASFVEARDEVQQALKLIAERGSARVEVLALQVLALRRYLRIGDKRLDANWSWTAEEAKRKASEEPGRTLYAEAAIVQRNFTQANPGYSLAVSPIRDLEKQVKLWNENDSVHQAGAKLAKSMRKELTKSSYQEVPSATTLAAFREALRSALVTPEPTNAAPGTSDHGRGTAVDFVVLRGSTPVANTKVAEIQTRWKRDGWEAKLIQACSGTKLKGPLRVPYEPWHWVLQ